MRLHELLVGQGIAMNQEVTFMSDGACNLRDLQYYMRPNAERFCANFRLSIETAGCPQPHAVARISNCSAMDGFAL